MSLTADTLVAAYIKLRDKADEMKKRHALEMEPIKNSMAQIDAALMQLLNTAGAEGIRTSAGTAFKALKTSATVKNWDATLGFIQEYERWDLLEHRVSKLAVEEHLKVTGELPPGVEYSSMYEVQVRRK